MTAANCAGKRFLYRVSREFAVAERGQRNPQEAQILAPLEVFDRGEHAGGLKPPARRLNL
jgi:hypothetical protein